MNKIHRYFCYALYFLVQHRVYFLPLCNYNQYNLMAYDENSTTPASLHSSPTGSWKCSTTNIIWFISFWNTKYRIFISKTMLSGLRSVWFSSTVSGAWRFEYLCWNIFKDATSDESIPYYTCSCATLRTMQLAWLTKLSTKDQPRYYLMHFHHLLQYVQRQVCQHGKRHSSSARGLSSDLTLDLRGAAQSTAISK